MIKNFSYVSFLFATLTAGAVAFAQAPAGEPAQDPQGQQGQQGQMGQQGQRMAGAAQAVTKTATVEKVDKKKRELVLKNDQGEKMTIKVPQEVQRFDQIKKGDTLKVSYYESIALSLDKGEKGAKPKMEESAMAERSPGDKPGGVAMKKITATAEITDINTDEDTLTLKGPQGQSHTIQIDDPALQQKLDTLKKGDMVKATYTEAIAVSVEPAQQDKAG